MDSPKVVGNPPLQGGEIDSPTLIEIEAGLADLLESRIQVLLNNLREGLGTEEIHADLASLVELVDEFKKSDDLLKKLLSPTTTDAEAEEIVDRLPDHYKIVAEQRAELRRLHFRSHHLFHRSAFLITKAQRAIDRTNHRKSRYALEVCGLCGGLGGSMDGPCVACKGKRSVLVCQPAIRCPRCKGNGKPSEWDRSSRCYGICLVCLGTGWALVLRDGQVRDLD